jgi:hypothetical protein
MTSSSSSNPPPPVERAVPEIIDKLPSHPGLITKTGTTILGSALLATAMTKVRRLLFPSRQLLLQSLFRSLYATILGVGGDILSTTVFFLLVALFREFRDRKDAD